MRSDTLQIDTSLNPIRPQLGRIEMDLTGRSVVRMRDLVAEPR